MNQDIIYAVKMQLIAAADNFYRAERAFGNMSEKELEQQHGQSGRTRMEIFDGYRKELARWENALAIAEGRS